MTNKFCYWTVADGSHGKMMETCIASARKVGVTEDFHVWSDKEVTGAITHPCGNFNKHKYLFKFRFLLNEVKKLDYDYFIWLDADNIFTRHPGEGTFDFLLRDSKIFVQLENECNSPKVKRKDWWGMDIRYWPQTLRYMGVDSKKIWNTNAGLWIVRKEFIEEFYKKAMEFWSYCYHELNIEFTEEAPLAYVGHVMQTDLEQSSLLNTHQVWACDWTGNYKNRLPDGKEWEFEDYMSGEKRKVNPCIVHAMRSKHALIKGSDLERHDLGFWIGHQLLGDVFGFCAAAHMMHMKTGKTIKIHFPQENRIGITSYFPGVQWVKKDEIPDAIDCGIDPTPSEWHEMNGVKRFYRHMDPTMENPLSFDIHMNISKNEIPSEKIIGIISHSVTQGPIDDKTMIEMCKEAKLLYPEHRLVLLGEKKNNFNFPTEFEIEDRRDSCANYEALVNQMKDITLLISPQTGPCFIAAGLRIPMWIYKSKEPYWDYVLNYDTHKVSRWWDRRSNET
jgi:hypothetical protein